MQSSDSRQPGPQQPGPQQPGPQQPGPQQTGPQQTGPFHVAIIMDGNGRWASRRGLPRPAGHRQGAKAVEPLLRTAAEMGVGVLTLYAFSSDNWRRPAPEVQGLMRLFGSYLAEKALSCRRRGIRLQVIGRRDRLAPGLLSTIEEAERLTRRQRGLLVRVAIDYSSRWAIAQAAGAVERSQLFGPLFRRALANAVHSDAVCDPDLIIRTGGEQRLSDFLLWESAYAELAFSASLFPDFNADELRQIVDEFKQRNRRFGGLRETTTAATASSSSRFALEAGRAGTHANEAVARGVESL